MFEQQFRSNDYIINVYYTSFVTLFETIIVKKLTNSWAPQDIVGAFESILLNFDNTIPVNLNAVWQCSQKYRSLVYNGININF